jgi:fatty-acyl-CoA synthase
VVEPSPPAAQEVWRVDDGRTEQRDEGWAARWERIADAQPDRLAVVVGDRELTWRDFDARSARVAGGLASLGVGVGARVALFMFNAPEHLETIYGAMKLGASPVNVDDRLGPDGIARVCDGAGAGVLVFHGALGERVAEAAHLMPTVSSLVQVDDGTPLVEGAVWFHELVEASAPAPRTVRAGTDVHPADGDGGAIRPVTLCAPSLTFGAPLLLVMETLAAGGTAVLVDGAEFDADEACDLVQLHHVTRIVVDGDAQAHALNAALDAAEAAGVIHDLSSIRWVVSTGSAISAGQRRALRRRAPQIVVEDEPFAVPRSGQRSSR